MGYAEAIERQMAATNWPFTKHGKAALGFLREEDPNGPDWDWLANIMARTLPQAAPFYVASHIGELLAGAGATLPTITVRRTDLPTPRGFVYFANHPLIPTSDALEVKVREDRARYGLEYAGEIRLAAVYWGVSDEGVLLVFYAGPAGLDPGFFQVKLLPWDAPYQPNDGIMTPSIRFLLGTIVTFFAFTQQRILVTSSRPIANRGVRKRLGKHIQEIPMVRVVELRRREHQQHDESHAVAVEWSCQWLVRGHWRQQYFPASNEHRPLWIEPHIKGPSDKPLKAPTITAYEVVR
jgi:hypothetical protein